MREECCLNQSEQKDGETEREGVWGRESRGEECCLKQKTKAGRKGSRNFDAAPFAYCELMKNASVHDGPGQNRSLCGNGGENNVKLTYHYDVI